MDLNLHKKVDDIIEIVKRLENEKVEKSFHQRQVAALQRQHEAVKKINFILEFIQNRNEVEQPLSHAWQIIMSVITHDLEDLREFLIGVNKS